jgi:hypothetical protein
VYCLCLGAELLFNTDIEYDYVTCNIMLSNKTFGIIYFSPIILVLDIIS